MSTEKRDFSKAAATWDEEPRRVKLAADVAKAIKDEIRLTPAMDVLDFGCGTGLLSLSLQPFVRSVTGVDSAQGMIDVLKAKAEAGGLKNVKAVRADLDKGDVLRGSYGLVTSSMTLHHIRDVGQLLGKLYGVTAPGGYLAIADLDPDGGRFHENSAGVFHDGFDRSEMRKTFADAGFTDIRDRTAAATAKPAPGGGTMEFSIFLMTGRKIES